jgi:hypothetical protein
MTRRRYLLLMLLGFAAICDIAYVWLGPKVTATWEWAGVELPLESGFEGGYSLHSTGRFERLDDTGKVIWSRKLEPSRFRTPHHDRERIYAQDGDGITAIYLASGEIAWHCPGPNEDLSLGHTLLFTRKQEWLVARSVETGAEAFRVQLPVEVKTYSAMEVGALVLVQDMWSRQGAWLLDRDGHLRRRFHINIVDAQPIGDDYLFLTSGGLIRVSADGQELWSKHVRFDEVNRGGLRRLADGDMLAFWYGELGATSVDVLRLNPSTDTVAWRTKCEPLGLTVSHPKSRDWVELETRGATARVTGRGSGGTFVELLDLKSGRQCKREVALIYFTRSHWLSWWPW